VNTLSDAHQARCHRWPAGAAAARVHRRSKTSTRPLFVRYSRAPSRPRAPLRFLQVDVSTSTTGTARTSRTTGVVGTTAVLDRESPRDPATAEGSQGQGSRAPSLDAPHRDCSRRRLRPNPDRFGHLLSRLPLSSRSGVTWGESDAANAARACKARVARGSCDARFPRRSRTLTNPRGLLSSAVRGANGEASLRTGKLLGDRIQRFFHHRRGARGTPARLLRWLGLPTRKSGEPPCCRRPQRPLTTSAFE